MTNSIPSRTPNQRVRSLAQDKRRGNVEPSLNPSVLANDAVYEQRGRLYIAEHEQLRTPRASLKEPHGIQIASPSSIPFQMPYEPTTCGTTGGRTEYSSMLLGPPHSSLAFPVQVVKHRLSLTPEFPGLMTFPHPIVHA